MLLRKNGGMLYPVLALLLTSACRSSIPPKIEICIGDGVGGANCVERDGARKYRPPSELSNYWMTSQVDEGEFAAWCYKTSPKVVAAQMELIRREIVR